MMKALNSGAEVHECSFGKVNVEEVFGKKVAYLPHYSTATGQKGFLPQKGYLKILEKLRPENSRISPRPCSSALPPIGKCVGGHDAAFTKPLCSACAEYALSQGSLLCTSLCETGVRSGLAKRWIIVGQLLD
jgi:hypothetical protein